MPQRNQLEQWFRQYSQDIYHFLIYYTGSTDVDDLVQDVFVKAYQSMDHFNGRSSVKTWLLKMARNQAIDRSRKYTRWIQLWPRLVDSTNNFEKGPEDIIGEQETLKTFYEASFQLKESYRVVLLLRLFEECSVEETAEILNWKTSKVTLTYHRAIKKLRLIFPLQDEEENPYGQQI